MSGLLGYNFSSVQFSRSVVSDPLQTHGLQYASLPCPSPNAGACSNSCPSSWYAIQTSYPLSFLSPPTFNLSQHQVFSMSQFFGWGDQSIELQLQHQSFQWIFRTNFMEDWLVRSPCSPRDSQESSPTPQFKSINSSALSFLYSPILMTTGKTIALTRQNLLAM